MIEFFHPHKCRDKRCSKLRSSVQAAGLAYCQDLRRKPQAKTNDSSMRSLLPVVIGNRTYDSLPDTNAPCNVMDENMASVLGVTVDRDPRKQRTFKNALGQHSRSLGVTSIRLSFAHDGIHQKWPCQFAVVAKCAASLVIGDPFLRLTRTMDMFRHRLKRVKISEKTWKLMHMDTPRRKISCHVDGEHVLGNADSGADADFASLKYAQLRGWDIQPLPDDKGFVTLADQQVVKVQGFVDANLLIQDEERQRRFCIIDGLICNVLLGDETIDVMEVFSKHQDSLVDLDLDLSSTTVNNEFCVIRWAEFYDEVGTFVNQQLRKPSKLESEGGGRKQRFLSRLGLSKRKTAKSLSDRDIEVGLMHKLEEVDIMEARFQLEASDLLSTLTGDELVTLKQLDHERRKKHKDNRQEIIRLIQHYRQWAGDER